MNKQTESQILELRREHGMTQKAICERLGIKRSVVRTVFIKHGISGHAATATEVDAGVIDEGAPAIIPPDIPDEDMPINELVDHLKKRSQRKIDTFFAKKWMRFGVNFDGPIGINFFGDMHVDDDGCDWNQLDKDINTVSSSEGMFAINQGDNHNNWVGRLMRLYAEQGATKKEAYALVRHVLFERGIAWILLLLGNHDEWNCGTQVMEEMNAVHKYRMESWRAKIKLEFPNGRELKIDSAHDHKGNSQWNPLHGQVKAVMMEELAHIVIAGHRHTAALFNYECGHTNFDYWCARARGYKIVDDHSHKMGFGTQLHGASIVAVIDPEASNEVRFVQCFKDVQEAADYLKFKRYHWEQGRRVN